MNEENDLYHDVEVDVVAFPVDCVGREEVMPVLNEMNTGNVLVYHWG